MIDLKNKKVLVTGGTGFLGSHIVEALCNRYCETIFFPKEKYNLTSEYQCEELFRNYKPDYVIHAAGLQGGIKFQIQNPIDVLEQNSKIAINTIKMAHKFEIKKLVNVLPSCSYPDKEILYEDQYLDGPSHSSVFFHGTAKRLSHAACLAYNKECGDNFVSVCLTNLFGPRANFHPEHSKVVEATIRKIVEAKERKLPYIEMWGTGTPTREFLFVEDAAEAVVQSLEKYDDVSKPLNIGSGDETSIKELVSLVCNAADYNGEIRWLTEKGDGQIRKMLCSDRMKEILDIEPTHLYIGLKKTIKWYQENKLCPQT